MKINEIWKMLRSNLMISNLNRSIVGFDFNFLYINVKIYDWHAKRIPAFSTRSNYSVIKIWS